MAKPYNLTLQLNLQGPSNLKPVVSRMRKELESVSRGNSLNISINKKSLNSIDKATKRLRSMSRVLREASLRSKTLNLSLTKLNKSLRSSSTNTKAAARGVQQVGVSAAKTSKQIQAANNSAVAFGKSLRGQVAKYVGFTAVNTAFSLTTRLLDEAVRAYIDYDRQLIRIQQVTNSSRGAISGLNEEIRRLSASLGTSAAELVQVSVTLAQTGLTAREVQSAIKAIAQASLAPTFTDMKQTAEGAIAAFNQFGIAANQLESVLDSINAVASRFAVEADDIIGAIQRTGGVFAAASKGVAEGTDALNQFIAVFTSVRSTTRESSETIATGLKTIFTRLQRLDTISSLQDLLGISLLDKGEFVGAYEAIFRISDAIERLGLSSRDVRFSQIVEQLGGVRQVGKVIPLLQEFAKAQDAYNVAQNSSGSTAKDAEKAQASVAVQLIRTREAWNELVSSFADNSVLKFLTQTFLTLTRSLFGFLKSFAGFAPILAIIAGAKVAKFVGGVAKGFSAGAKEAGGSGGLGEKFGKTITGAGSEEKAKNQAQAVQALTSNTTALTSLEASVNKLATKLDQLPVGGSGSNRILPFASGGVVPGSGNRDTVPAMLTPGEFVIRKNAVSAIGADKLQSMNKYKDGGRVLQENRLGAISLFGSTDYIEDEITKNQVIENTPKEWQSKVKTAFGKQNKKWVLERQRPPDELTAKLKENVEKGIVSATNNATKTFGNNLGITSLPKIDSSNEKNFLAGVNEASIGNLFEQILSNINVGGAFTNADNPKRPFDFTEGLNSQITKVWDKLEGVNFVDARANLGTTSSGVMSKKVAQLLYQDNTSFLDTKNFTPSSSDLESKIRKLLQKIPGAENGVTNKILTSTEGTTLNKGEKVELATSGLAKRFIFKKDGNIVNPDTEGATKEELSPKEEAPTSFGYMWKFTDKLLQDAQEAAKGGFIQKFMAGGYAKPPSEKQLGFLKSLVAKSGVPEGFDYPPKTSQEASALINALKNPQVAPREGQTIESVFDEYKNIFGIEHEYAKYKDVPDFFGEQKQDYIRDINSTIQRFDKFARIIRTYYGKGITKSGSEFLAFGGVGQKNQTMPLDSFVSGGSFDENLLQEFYNRGKFAFGSTLNANQTTTGKKGHIGRSFQRRAFGGLIQKFMAGGGVKELSRSINVSEDQDALHDALINYTEDSAGINLGLSGQRKIGSEQKKTIASLDQLFNFDYYPPEDLYAGFGSTRTKILTGGLDAYGVPASYTLSPSEIENKGPVSFPGYFSTSASKAVADRFRGSQGSLVHVDAKPPVIDVIKAAADLGVNLPRSLHQELEYILPKNSQFAVENLKVGDNGDTKADLKQLKLGGLIQKFAEGGSAEDTVPALLTPGEFVINKQAAARIGSADLNRLNKADKVQGFNKGGPVGFVQRFAAGGEAEATKFIQSIADMMSESFEEVVDNLGQGLSNTRRMNPGEKKGDVDRGFLIGILKDIKGMQKETGEKFDPKVIQGLLGKGLFGGAKIPDLLSDSQASKIVQSLIDVIAKSKEDRLSAIYAKEKEDKASGASADSTGASSYHDDFAEYDAAREAAIASRASSSYHDDFAEYDAAREAAISSGAASSVPSVPGPRMPTSPAEANLEARLNLPAVIEVDMDAEPIVESVEQKLEEVVVDAAAAAQKIQAKQAEAVSANAGKLGSLGGFLQKSSLGKKFLGSKLGSKLGGASDFVAGKGSSAVSQGIGKLLKLGGKFPGGLNALGIAAGTGLQYAQDNFLTEEQKRDPTTRAGFAGAKGGIAGATAGFAVAGPLGAVVGGVVGALKSFRDELQRAKVDEAFRKISKATVSLGKSFDELDQGIAGASNRVNRDAGNIIANQGELKSADSAGTFGENFGKNILGSVLTLGLLPYLQSNAAAPEARQGLVEQASTLQDAATRKASYDISKLSESDLAATDGKFIQAQYAEFIAAAEGGLDNVSNARRREIESMAAAEAALNAYRIQRQEEGADANTIAKEIEQNRQQAIASGNRQLERNNELIKKQAIQARATKEVAIAVAAQADIYARLTANLQRAGEATDYLIGRVDDYINMTQGATVDRRNEQVLGNLLAYTPEEIQTASAPIASALGGTQEAVNLANNAKVAKVLQEDLPARLRGAQTREERLSIISDLRAQFSNLGIDTTASDAILQDIARTIEENQDVGTLLEEIDNNIIGQFSDVVAQGQAALQNAVKSYNDNLQKLIDQQNKYNQALARARQYITQAGIIRIDAENRLAEALGKNVSLEKLNASIDLQTRSLTQGLVDRGALSADQATDPESIGKGIKQLRESNESLIKKNEEIRAQQAQLGTGPDAQLQSQELDQQYRDNLSAIQENNQALSDSKTALENMANSTAKADNALRKLEKSQREVAGGADFLQSVLTNTPQQNFDMTRQMGAFQAMMAGDQGVSMSRRGRSDAFAGLDIYKSLGLSDAEYNSARADLIEQQLTAQGVDMNQQVTVGENKFTISELLDRMRNPEDSPEVKAYKEATQQQIDANMMLADLEYQNAEMIAQSIEKLENFFRTEFPNALKDAISGAENAGQRPQMNGNEMRRVAEEDLNAANADLERLEQKRQEILERRATRRRQGTPLTDEQREQSAAETRQFNQEKRDALDRKRRAEQDIQIASDFQRADEVERQRREAEASAEASRLGQESERERTGNTQVPLQLPNMRYREQRQAGMSTADIIEEDRARAASLPGREPPTSPSSAPGSSDTARAAEADRLEQQLTARGVDMNQQVAVGENKFTISEILDRMRNSDSRSDSRAPVGVVSPDLEAMARMANEATVPGSIYTHDIHSGEILKQILAVLSTGQNNTQGIANGVVERQAGNAAIAQASLSEDSLNKLATFNQNFATYVDKLVNFSFPTIPDTIQFNANHVVEVRFTGAASLNQLEKSIQQLAITETNKAMNQIWDQSGGNFGRRPEVSQA